MGLAVFLGAVSASAVSGLSNYGAFGKWTHTASSPRAAAACSSWSVRYLNTRAIVRNASKPDYRVVGPTGCAGVVRHWAAQRFLVGDNQYHWVYDATRPASSGGAASSSSSAADGNVTVAGFHAYLASIHGDLTGAATDWSDFSFGSYAGSADDALARFEADGAATRLVEGFDEDGLPAYSVYAVTPDGYLYETVSPSTASPGRFLRDACHFRPLERFRSYNLTDAAFEAASVVKLGEYTTAAPARVAGARETTPHHTSLPSPDPSRDAAFLEWLLSGRVLNGSSVARLEECADRNETWVHFGAAGGIGKSNDHYLRLVDDAGKRAAAAAARGPGYYSTLDHARVVKARRNLAANVYDAFLDDHVGLDLAAPELAKIVATLVASDAVWNPTTGFGVSQNSSKIPTAVKSNSFPTILGPFVFAPRVLDD